MALVLLFVGLIVASLIANMLIATPFRKMLEGKGLLFFNLDSTGVIRISILGLKSPYIKGKVGGKEISDVWDRSTVMQMEAPIENTTKIARVTDGVNKGGLKFEIDEKKYNEARFALFHYPVLVWNDQIGSLVTKDFLAEKEKGTFAEHGILFLNRRVEELTSQIRDFARYVVETTRPKKSILQNKWLWIVIIFFVVIFALIFMPQIIKTIQSFWGTASGGVASATANTNPITPRG